MGLARETVRALVALHAKCPIMGPVLLLGRQHVFVTLAELTDEMARYNLTPKHDAPDVETITDIPGWIEGRRKAYISDSALFRTLAGVEVVHTDISDYEGAELVWDLNTPIPQSFEGRYSTIIDGGTLEHIFDVRVALQNVVRLLRPGGQVVHITQASNWIDHGYYQFSPILFFDYYDTNGFQQLQCLVAEQGRGDVTRNRWHWYEWQKHESTVLMSTGQVGLVFCAVKGIASLPSTPSLQSTLVTRRPAPSRWMPLVRRVVPTRAVGWLKSAYWWRRRVRLKEATASRRSSEQI